jgi:heat shock protein HslJ
MMSKSNFSTAVFPILLIGILLLILVGCSSHPNPLDGTEWKLVGWNLNSLNAADFTITAKFTKEDISGNSAVNSYSGSYKLGNGGSFSVGPVAGTLMAGPEPAMRAESTYLTLLDQAGSYKLVDGKLILYDKGENESLIFEPAK